MYSMELWRVFLDYPRDDSHPLYVHASRWLTANKWPFSPHIASILYFISTLLYVFLFQHVCSCNYILKYYIEPIKQIDCRISCIVTNILHFWTIYSMWPANYCQSCHLKLVKFVNWIWEKARLGSYAMVFEKNRHDMLLKMW